MWAFNSPPNYGVNTNPTQGELFVNDKIDRSEALIQETVQNSLDAKRPESLYVEVAFTLQGGEANNSKLKQSYLLDLTPHLQACGVEFGSQDFLNPSVLLVEDFGTSGLRGKTD